MLKVNLCPCATFVTLSGRDYTSLMEELSQRGIAGGLVYDAIIAQAAELAQALSTGVVEAHMTSGATGVDIKVWDSMGKGAYYYDAQAWLPKNLVVVNQKAFDALDKATQDAVLKAAADAETRGWKTSEARNKDTLDTMARNGMIVAPPSAALKADLKKIGATMLAEWEKNAGADAKTVLDAYRK